MTILYGTEEISQKNAETWLYQRNRKKVTGNPYRSPKLYTFDEEAYKDAKKIGMRLEF